MMRMPACGLQDGVQDSVQDGGRRRKMIVVGILLVLMKM